MKLGFVLETAAALYLLLSPAQSLPLSNTNRTSGVLTFQEVWGRSFCRTIEKLVEVVQEYPAEVEHIYSPSCVPLVRCAGCCGDENLECHPTRTSNVTMQLLKIRPSEPGQEYVEMTFVEHQTCECRVKKPIVKVESKRQRGRGRKRKEKQKMKECVRSLAGNCGHASPVQCGSRFLPSIDQDSPPWTPCAQTQSAGSFRCP